MPNRLFSSVLIFEYTISIFITSFTAESEVSVIINWNFHVIQNGALTPMSNKYRNSKLTFLSTEQFVYSIMLASVICNSSGFIKLETCSLLITKKIARIAILLLLFETMKFVQFRGQVAPSSTFSFLLFPPLSLFPSPSPSRLEKNKRPFASSGTHYSDTLDASGGAFAYSRANRTRARREARAFNDKSPPTMWDHCDYVSVQRAVCADGRKSIVWHTALRWTAMRCCFVDADLLHCNWISRERGKSARAGNSGNFLGAALRNGFRMWI